MPGRSYAVSGISSLRSFDPLWNVLCTLTDAKLDDSEISEIGLAEGILFHVLDPDNPNLIAHCADYDAAIGDGFDLVLLGIGLNGHLGMNEPGSPIDSPTRRVELHDSTVQSSARYFKHKNLPRWGLTVGLKALLGAKEVWLLAKGPAKAKIVEETLRGEIGPSIPASLLRRHPNAWLFLDKPAGA